MNNNDKFFKNIADRYVEQLGSELSKQPAASVSDKDGSYSEMKSRIRRQRIKKLTAFGIPAAAAAVICLLLTFAFINGGKPPSVLDNTVSPLASPSTSVSIIQLSGTRFSITDEDFDNGKIIYSINDNSLDDHAVVTFEKTVLPDLSDYQTAETGGSRVYYKSEDNYYILLYQVGDYIVTMSCRYEMSTLRALSRNMKINF